MFLKKMCCRPRWPTVNFLQCVQLHRLVCCCKRGSQCGWKLMLVTCECQQLTERNLALIHTEAGLQQCLYSVPNTAAQKQKTISSLMQITCILMFALNQKFLIIAIKTSCSQRCKYNHQKQKSEILREIKFPSINDINIVSGNNKINPGEQGPRFSVARRNFPRQTSTFSVAFHSVENLLIEGAITLQYPPKLMCKMCTVTYSKIYLNAYRYRPQYQAIVHHFLLPLKITITFKQ